MEVTEVMAMLKRGDPAAAEILVALLAPQLYWYAASIAPDLSQADQELAVERALTSVAGRIEDYDQERASLMTWARGFVRNALHRAKREGARVESLSDMNAQVPERRDDDQEVSPRDIRLNEIILTSLSDAEYLLLVLRISERLSHAEIAKLLELSEEAVKKRYQRLLAKIRRLIEDDPLITISPTRTSSSSNRSLPIPGET